MSRHDFDKINGQTKLLQPSRDIQEKKSIVWEKKSIVWEKKSIVWEKKSIVWEKKSIVWEKKLCQCKLTSK